MDLTEAFADYCRLEGLACEGGDTQESGPQVLDLADGTDVAVTVSDGFLRLEADAGSPDAYTEEALLAMLAAPTVLAQGPLAACPVHFALDRGRQCLVIQGERSQLADGQDFADMLSAFASLAAHYRSLAAGA